MWAFPHVDIFFCGHFPCKHFPPMWAFFLQAFIIMFFPPYELFPCGLFSPATRKKICAQTGLSSLLGISIVAQKWHECVTSGWSLVLSMMYSSYQEVEQACQRHAHISSGQHQVCQGWSQHYLEGHKPELKLGVSSGFFEGCRRQANPQAKDLELELAKVKPRLWLSVQSCAHGSSPYPKCIAMIYFSRLCNKT